MEMTNSSRKKTTTAAPGRHTCSVEWFSNPNGNVMRHVQLSKHALLRCVQRGIDQKLIDTILDWGREEYDHRGACRYYLGHAEKRKLTRDAPDLLRKYGRKLDAVVVMPTDHAAIITVFVRNRRI
jgi:hypothetical protein